MSASRILFALSLAALLTTACGTRSYVVAPKSQYPISLSSAVRDEAGEVVPVSRLQKLGTFKHDYNTCSMIWTIIPLGGRTRDISKAVNEQIAEREGEAIINLRVEAGAYISSIATMFGLLPDCNNVKIRGDIVERIPDVGPVAGRE